MHTTESVTWDIIPSTSAVLHHETVRRLGLRTDILTGLIGDAVNQLRRDPPLTREAAVDTIVARVTEAAQAYQLPGRRYINATGIVIHTQWGNAPLSRAAKERLESAAEVSPTGAHDLGERTAPCERLLVALTGADAAMVTTSNAASCLLVATGIAGDREVICAARDLIEISHGVRLRNILESAGANVVPVGAANCVYLNDYRCAIDADSAAIVRIHAANTATTGYTAHVATAELAKLAHSASLPLLVNLGSGSLVDLRERGLPPAPTLRAELRAGADLVLASGDKLIGGPQAGVIVGRRDLVQRLARHPVARCCQPGKLTLAALEATLASYVAGRGWEEIPVLRLLAAPSAQLHQRASAIAKHIQRSTLTVDVASNMTECGGATLPGVALSTWTLRLVHPSFDCDELYDALLQRGVVARRHDNAVVLDLRSIFPEDESALVAAVNDAALSIVEGTAARGKS